MDLSGLRRKLDSVYGFGADTAIVAFFLGLELGISLQELTLGTWLLGLTVLMVIVLPYFLTPNDRSRPSLAKWLTVRSLVTISGLGIGVFPAGIPVALFPDSIKFLPLSLLIIASGISCFIRFYALMRLRLAK